MSGLSGLSGGAASGEAPIEGTVEGYAPPGSGSVPSGDEDRTLGDRVGAGPKAQDESGDAGYPEAPRPGGCCSHERSPADGPAGCLTPPAARGGGPELAQARKCVGERFTGSDSFSGCGQARQTALRHGGGQSRYRRRRARYRSSSGNWSRPPRPLRHLLPGGTGCPVGTVGRGHPRLCPRSLCHVPASWVQAGHPVGRARLGWRGRGCVLARFGGVAGGLGGGRMREPGLVPGARRRGPARRERRGNRVRFRLGGDAGLVRGADACRAPRGAPFPRRRYPYGRRGPGSVVCGQPVRLPSRWRRPSARARRGRASQQAGSLLWWPEQ